MSKQHVYTFRFSEKEFGDIRQCAERQGIPITQVVRMGLLYLYAHTNDIKSFNNVSGITSLLKEKILTDSGISNKDLA